jgi:hypothetical protein
MLTLSATNIFTIVTDLLMLALPVPIILRMKRQRAQTAGILVALIAGGLSLAASCIRLYSIVEYASSSEPLRSAAPIQTWSFIEINAGMCCASVAGKLGVGLGKEIITTDRTAVITPLFTAYSVRLSAIISPIDPPNGMDSFANYETWPYGRAAPMGRYMPAEVQGSSLRTTESLTSVDTPRDVDGRPIRISKPLPALPKGYYHNHNLTALPQCPSQPMLYAIATYRHNNIDPVYQSRVVEREVQEVDGAGMW